MSAKAKLIEGDRVVVKWSDGPVMAYLVSYYNGWNDYAICSDNADGSDQFIAPRRRVFKAPADPPPVANIQVFEATVSMHREALEDHAPPPTATNKEA